MNNKLSVFRRSTLLCALLFLSVMSLKAQVIEYEYGGCIYDLYDSDKTAELDCVTSPEETMEIPEYVTYEGDRYKVICIYSFNYREDNGGKVISSYSERINTTTKYITLPSTVEKIASYAFAFIPLVKINIPSSVKIIEKDAFLYTVDESQGENKTLETVEISDLNSWLSIRYLNDDGGVSTYNSNPLKSRKTGELTIRNGNETTVIKNSIRIPDDIKKMPDYCLSGLGVKYVDIPSNVEEIGKGVFEECKNLSEIRIPSTVRTKNIIGLFGSCTNLRVADIAAPVEEYYSSFFNCRNLEKVHLSASVKVIAFYSFLACGGLRKIFIDSNTPPELIDDPFDLEENTCPIRNITLYVPNGCAESYRNAETWNEMNIVELPYTFSYNDEKGEATIIKANSGDRSITDIFIPAFTEKDGKRYKVTILEPCVFEDCNNLTKVYGGENLTYIGFNNFDKVSSDDDFIYLGNTLYKYTGSDTNVVVKDGTKRIDSNAFQDNSRIESVTLPSSVTSIGGNAFSYCSNLKEIKGGENVVEVGDYVLNECKSLNAKSAPIYIGKVLCKYEGGGDIDVKDGTVAITGGALAYNGDVTGVTLPSSLTSVGSDAFSCCRSLKSIVLPDAVTYLGDNVFQGCTSLESIQFPSSIKKIGYYMMMECEKLDNVVIPEGVTEIAEGAFSHCQSLKTITFPTTLASIGSEAFNDTPWFDGLTGDVYIHSLYYLYAGQMPDNTVCNINEGTKYINKGAFYGQSGLTEVNLPGSMETIGEEAFYQCGNLASINVNEESGTYRSVAGVLYNKDLSSLILCPTGYNAICNVVDGVKSISDRAFYGCANIAYINIPKSVTAFGRDAFSGFRTITSITIPSSVKSFDASFGNCPSLTDIYSFNTSPETCNWYDFRSIASTATLHVPAGTADLYKSTDGWKEFSNIVEIADENINITDAGYATAFLPYATIVPEGVKVYTMTKIEGNVATLKELDADDNGRVILPAYTGVILKSSTDNYSFAPTEEYAVAPENILEGTVTEKECEANTVMTLANVDGTVGLYNYTGTSLAAHKAYLSKSALAEEGAQGAKVIYFEFEGGGSTPTGITDVNAVNNGENDIYTIEGVKVDKIDHKGIYVRNGKKIFVK